MSSRIQHLASQDTPNFSPRLYGIVILLASIILSGMWLVTRFTAMDLQRDLQTWQEKLNLIAESRSADIDKWVNDHFTELQTLADNPSMQLYMTELSAQPEKSQGGEVREPAQKAYLRNLMLYTAQRAGFTTKTAMSSIPADVQPESKSGLAILDDNNAVVVSTQISDATRDMMITEAKNLPAGQRGLIDMQKDADGTPYMGFIMPIYSIQGEHNANSQIGRIVAIKTIGDNFLSLLKHPGVTEKTLETILISQDGDKINYLTPLLDGSAALSKHNERDSKNAETSLLDTVGSFVSDMQDYRKEKVLATSRQIEGTPWVLVVKIDRKEAFAQSGERRFDMMMICFLIIGLIVLIIAAIWWYAHSQRAMMMSQHFRKMAARSHAQEKLLRIVADNQPEPIYILDENRTYRFANQKAADEVGMSHGSLIGKSVGDVRGGARSEPINALCERALGVGKICYDVQRFTEEGAMPQVIRSAYVPLDNIPVPGLAAMPGVLVVEQDISQVIFEREQRLSTQRQLVQTLVNIVDMRDPFAANHSLLVSQVAYEIAVEMELDYSMIETTRTAGSLMNIGKIVVPLTLLTKTASLTDAEKAVVRESMDAAANLLKDISFDGPVVETLKQWQEKFDGSGLLGAKGDGILICARIIAVANAFVGMISPRSWRDAMPVDAASKLLLEEAGIAYDRRVVIALISYMDNHGGRAWLKQIIEEQKVA